MPDIQLGKVLIQFSRIVRVIRAGSKRFPELAGRRQFRDGSSRLPKPPLANRDTVDAEAISHGQH
jgi:hypothetical protein